MDQRGSAAEPFSTSPHAEFPAARLQAWATLAAASGAGTTVPTQESCAA